MIYVLGVLYGCMTISALLPFYRNAVSQRLLLPELLIYFYGVPLVFCFLAYTPDTVMIIINFCGVCLMIIYVFQHAQTIIELLAGLKRPCLLPSNTAWRPFLTVFARRTLLAIVLLTLTLLIFDRQRLFTLLRESDALWRLCLYSVISAVPQEFIYRRFWFDRYSRIIPRSQLLIINAVTFSFMHIIFWHPIPLLLTFAAGYWIGDSYRRFKSLLFACLEHAVYGSLAFVIGYHTYFHFL
jgi:uncharacterized protein